MPARATLNGTITNTGGENCTQRGFDWGVTSGVYPNSWTETGSYGTGAFSHLIDNLDLNKVYYFRAKALNSAGWGYGGEKSFQTPAPVTVRLTAPMIRAMTTTVAKGKIIRSDLVVHIRKQWRKFETQPALRSVFIWYKNINFINLFTIPEIFLQPDLGFNIIIVL
jgi:hypothetical protein